MSTENCCYKSREYSRWKIDTNKGKSRRTELHSHGTLQYVIRFYCIVNWKTTYLCSIFDNGSGNSTRKSSVEKYVEVFPAMRTPIVRVLGCGASAKIAKAFWSTMSAQQTQSDQAPTGRRFFYQQLLHIKWLRTVSKWNVRRRNTPHRNYEAKLHRSGKQIECPWNDS